MLRLEGVSKQIQGQTLFAGVDLVLQAGDRLGVIGVNGCGKSTLLKILGGLVDQDQGTRWVADGYSVGYLPQAPTVDGQLTVQEAVYQAQSEIVELWHEYQRICEDPGDLRRLGEVQGQLEQAGFFQLQVRADVAIQQLGLAHLDQPLERLSGGQRRRVALAQVLTRQPDLLLLDEPTNHLDTDSIDWLEGYLRGYSGAVVMVTHDRYFLDRITSRTLEIEEGRVTCYQGNYARYLEKKAELREQAEASESKRANLWRRELEWLRRGPRARATKQKARIERAYELQPEAQQKQAGLEIGLGSQRLGRKVLEVKGLSKSFGDVRILRNFDFSLEPGTRLGVIGPNGSGKTTLLEMFSGRLAPDAGTVEMGSTVRLGYFDQENRQLDPDQKVIDSLREVAESIPLANGMVLTAAQMLERFLFSGRLQHTLVGKLSGGERRRLYLLQVLMSNPNLLFLDEPSNDLDIPTLSCLEDYLDNFPGSLVVSSHDRYLLDRCVDQLLAFEGGDQPRRVPGGYSDYVQQRPAPAAAPSRLKAPAAAQVRPPEGVSKVRRLSFKEKRELEQLEGSISRAETRQSELEAVLVEQATNYGAVRQAHDELEKLKSDLEAQMERWAELAELAD
jgi:ATP-binding cassette subfamily F protein uup